MIKEEKTDVLFFLVSFVGYSNPKLIILNYLMFLACEVA